MATAWLGVNGNDLQVAQTRGFESLVWVELSDDIADLQGKPGTLVYLANGGNGVLTIDPSSVPPGGSGSLWSDKFVNPKVRRWDQSQAGDIVLQQVAVPVTETSPGTPVWIPLEDGIEVQFAPGGNYRTGDYWLIPARVATGNIEWPLSADGKTPASLPPRGVHHHYAPLGFYKSVGPTPAALTSCRCVFIPGSGCFKMPAPVDAAPPAADAPGADAQPKQTAAQRKAAQSKS